MTDKLTMPLWNEQQAHAAVQTIWRTAKAHLSAGRRMVLSLAPETRSDAENRLLHTLLSHIAKTTPWAGKKRDTDTWKRLMVAAWCRATNEQVEILPAIDGHGVDIVFCKTSKLSRADCAGLIDFICAWGAMNDVTFPASPQEIGQSNPKFSAT